jgi:hypothetical protein
MKVSPIATFANKSFTACQSTWEPHRAILINALIASLTLFTVLTLVVSLRNRVSVAMLHLISVVLNFSD